MSHIVTIATQIRDLEALRAACRRLNLPEPVHETVRLFSGEATGHAVQLPGWTYPVACEMATGQLRYDNFEGRWGDQEELDRFMQIYAVEKSTHSQCTSCYDSCRLVTRGNSLHFCLAL